MIGPASAVRSPSSLTNCWGRRRPGGESSGRSPLLLLDRLLESLVTAEVMGLRLVPKEIRVMKQRDSNRAAG